VTAIEFGVKALDELYAGAFFFEIDRASDVLHTWASLLSSFPDELMSWASLMHFPPIPEVPAFARGRSFAVVMAAFQGDAREGRSLLRALEVLGPVRDTFATVPPVVLADLAMDPLDPLPFHIGHQLLDELPASAIDGMLTAAGPGSGRGETLTILQLRHMGGALARPAPGAGARATLPGEVCLVTIGVAPDADAEQAVRSAIADVEAAVLPHRAGYYPNFIEEPVDTAQFFDPETWRRLREIKARYDGDDLFAGNHHIPPAA
jgi:hypothetical protein